MTTQGDRPHTHRLAGWIAIALGGIYVLLTPLWVIWTFAWKGYSSFFWPLEIAAIAAVVVGIVLVVRAGRVESLWRDSQLERWAHSSDSTR